VGVLAAHHQTHFARLVVLQNLQVPGPAIFPLLVNEAEQFGAIAEQGRLVFLTWKQTFRILQRFRLIKFTKRGAFDSAKNHKRQSITAKREKSQTPKFVCVRLG